MNRKLGILLLVTFASRTQCDARHERRETPVQSVCAEQQEAFDDAFIDAMLDQGVIKPEVKSATPAVYWVQTIGWKLLHNYWYVSDCVRGSLRWTRKQLSTMVRYATHRKHA